LRSIPTRDQKIIIKKLQATVGHYVYLADMDKTPIEVGHLKISDSLWVQPDSDEDKLMACVIVSLDAVTMEGAHTLFTTSGTMIANGFVVSSYANPYFDEEDDESYLSAWFSHNWGHGLTFLHRVSYTWGLPIEWMRAVHDGVAIFF
jgi:hypothetical protein